MFFVIITYVDRRQLAGVGAKGSGFNQTGFNDEVCYTEEGVSLNPNFIKYL